MWLKDSISWVEDKWVRFEALVAKTAPQAKTKIVAALGAVSGLAATFQEYISGLPLNDIVSSKTLALINAGLFTLAFWLRGIGQRVEEREHPVVAELIKEANVNISS